MREGGRPLAAAGQRHEDQEIWPTARRIQVCEVIVAVAHAVRQREVGDRRRSAATHEHVEPQQERNAPAW